MWSVSSTLQLILGGVSPSPWDHHNINFLTHNSNTKPNRFLQITYSLSNDHSPSSSNHNHLGYDPSLELFGLDDMPPRDAKSDEPKSWFGPNGQYIRELPCPSCRGRGYTPCSECGIERSRQDCSLCNGKGIMTCQHCLGECVIWEESIDENPWEKARSISPLKVKEDDEVDKLELNLDARKKPKRVYRSTPPEVGLKISRSLKSLNAKTGLFSKRMKIIHRDPELHAQRVAAIKKAKSTAAARKHTSETLKIFFSDPENRRKRSVSMKGVRFFCKNCGIEGHRSNYCPDRQENIDRSFKCGLCGEKGHNRRTCGKPRIIKVNKRILGKYHCRACGKVGHNCRTCSLKTELLSHSDAHVRRGYLENSKVQVQKHHHHCSICGKVGHNRSTCSLKTVLKSDSTAPEIRGYVENSKEEFKGSHDASKGDDGGSLEDPEVEYRGSLGYSKGLDKSFLEDSNKISYKHYYHCSLCGEVGHNRRTCPLKMELESDITPPGATFSLEESKNEYRGSLEDPKRDYRGSLGKDVYKGALKESNVITIKHHCSLCGKVGHNRRTCSLSESGSLRNKGSLKDLKEFVQNRCHHCSICGKSGHNRRTCYESPSEDIEVTSRLDKSSRSYHCRICGVNGHNRRTCVNTLED